MEILRHTDLNDLRTPYIDVVYFKIPYLKFQQHENINIFKNDHYFIPFSIDNQCATSIDKSPFGSFIRFNNALPKTFITFENEIINILQFNKLEQIVIRHPSPIYSDFVDSSDISKVGYDTLYNDINQHIVLTDDWEGQIHLMQSRKLKSLKNDGFEFKKIPQADLKLAHQFLAICRQTQGLQINISYEKLQKLCTLLPNTYELFGVYREEKLSAVCITVNATSNIAYYYLAGTSPLFRSQSPMVLLIAGMVEYYRNKGFQYLDMGVSSFEGNSQETLRLFKERMGAVESIRPTFIKSLAS